MPNIVLCRVDQRLIHGQVLTQWLKYVGANLILVANDEISNDSLRQNLMNVAVPSGVQTRYFNLQKTIDIIHKAADHQKILLLVQTIEDAHTLILNGVPIETLNIGNIHLEQDRVSLNDYVALNTREHTLLSNLIQKDVEVYLQRVPSEPKIQFKP